MLYPQQLVHHTSMTTVSFLSDRCTVTSTRGSTHTLNNCIQHTAPLSLTAITLMTVYAVASAANQLKGPPGTRKTHIDSRNFQRKPVAAQWPYHCGVQLVVLLNWQLHVCAQGQIRPKVLQQSVSDLHAYTILNCVKYAELSFWLL